MIDPNIQERAKYALKEIVFTPYPAQSDIKGSNISQGRIVKMSHCPESGFYYEVRLPELLFGYLRQCLLRQRNYLKVSSIQSV